MGSVMRKMRKSVKGIDVDQLLSSGRKVSQEKNLMRTLNKRNKKAQQDNENNLNYENQLKLNQILSDHSGIQVIKNDKQINDRNTIDINTDNINNSSIESNDINTDNDISNSDMD